MAPLSPAAPCGARLRPRPAVLLALTATLVLGGGGRASATPRWQFTDAAEWVDARTSAPGEGVGESVVDAAAARAVLARRRAPALVPVWVEAARLCDVAPGLVGSGSRLALHVDGALTAATGPCVAAISPAALAVKTGDHLPPLPRLRALSIVTATDADLTALASFTALESLAIGHAFSDGGLAALVRLPALHTLELIGADKAGATLATLTRVRALTLSSMTVQRAQLVAVGALRALRTLDLGAAGVDGADLEVLVRLPALSRLSVRSDALPDALGPVGRLVALRALVIEGAPLDDGMGSTLTAWSRRRGRVKVTRPPR